MQATLRPHAPWRSWLLLIIGGGGALLSLMAGIGLLTGGGMAATSIPELNMTSQTFLNLGWVLLLIGGLSLPGAVHALREIQGKEITARPRRHSFLLSSLGMIAWALMVFLFKSVETSPQAWLLLPPLILLMTVLPLWWYLEIGRYGLEASSPARTWGITSFSLVVTLPLIVVLESLVMIILLVIGAAVLSNQPGFAEQLAQLQRLAADPNIDPQALMDLFTGYLQQPGVIFAILALVSGVIPLLEEFFKPLAVWLFAGDRLTPGQGFMAGMLSGAGFALWENLIALSASGDGFGTIILVARIGTGLLHILTAGLTGWALASFWQKRQNGWQLAGAYLLAVALHGMWNAAGVISGVAPMLQVPFETPHLSQTIETAAIAALGLLVITCFGIMLAINGRLRKEQMLEADARAATDFLPGNPDWPQDLQTPSAGNENDSETPVE